jgi:hypothetical protein
MKARLRLFQYFLGLGYCYTAAWKKADRELAFQRRTKY